MLNQVIDSIGVKAATLVWVLLGFWEITRSEVAFWFTIAASLSTILFNFYKYKKEKRK